MLNIAREKWPEARTDLEVVLLKSSDDAQTVVDLGTTVSKLGDNELAVELDQKAISMDPSAAHADFNRGLALSELGDLDRAESGLRAAIDLQPGHVGAMNALGTGRTLLNEDLFSQTEALSASDDIDDRQHCKLKFALDHQY